jgi:CoA:oxalate CoA-transferase
MSANEPYLPLDGVRVLAWEQAVALPIATRLLVDLGATVIRVESHTRAAARARYLGNDLARNKLGLAIDLRREEGRALLRRLLTHADIFCENFTPRVKRQFKLTYDAVSAENPRLIMLSLCGYGQTGAWLDRPTFGPGIEASSGHARSMGYPDEPPTRPGTTAYADNISGFYAALALLGALMRRRTTGRGQYIDVSMYEANAFHLGPSILRSSLTGSPEPRRGNSDPNAFVQNVYESRDPERWVAVTVRPDQQAQVIDLLSAAGDPAAVDAALASWVRSRSAEEGVEVLQGLGIAAAPALNARDVLQNEQLRSREAFQVVAHASPVGGYAGHPHAVSPFRFVGHSRTVLQEAPSVGQDSRRVLHDWLGMGEDEAEELIQAGVVGEVPASPAPAPDTRHIQRKLEWKLAADWDSDPGKVLGMSPAPQPH